MAKKKKLPIQAQMRLHQSYLESKHVHEDTLTERALIKRIADMNRELEERDRLYDLENGPFETFDFSEWDE